jgi:uncharacterized integral membrane protein
MGTIKSTLRTLKIGINLTLLTVLIIVLAQNLTSIDVDLLFWEVHVPLIFLLLGTAVLSALIVFLSMLVKRK